MAIQLENMVGYIRSRNKMGRKGEVELYIDPVVKTKQTPKGPVITKPEDCNGILYIDPQTGKLVVEYPEE